MALFYVALQGVQLTVLARSTDYRVSRYTLHLLHLQWPAMNLGLYIALRRDSFTFITLLIARNKLERSSKILFRSVFFVMLSASLATVVAVTVVPLGGYLDQLGPWRAIALALSLGCMSLVLTAFFTLLIWSCGVLSILLWRLAKDIRKRRVSLVAAHVRYATLRPAIDGLADALAVAMIPFLALSFTFMATATVDVITVFALEGELNSVRLFLAVVVSVFVILVTLPPAIVSHLSAKLRESVMCAACRPRRQPSQAYLTALIFFAAPEACKEWEVSGLTLNISFVVRLATFGSLPILIRRPRLC